MYSLWSLLFCSQLHLHRIDLLFRSLQLTTIHDSMQLCRRTQFRASRMFLIEPLRFFGLIVIGKRPSSAMTNFKSICQTVWRTTIDLSVDSGLRRLLSSPSSLLLSSSLHRWLHDSSSMNELSFCSIALHRLVRMLKRLDYELKSIFVSIIFLWILKTHTHV